MKHLEIECKWDANTPRAFYKARQFLAQLKKLRHKNCKLKTRI